MKKKIISALLSTSVLATSFIPLTSCNDEPKVQTITVTLDVGTGSYEGDKEIKVDKGSTEHKYNLYYIILHL